MTPVLDWTKLVASKITDRFKSKVSVYYETDQYLVKTAENAVELEQVLKLRHKVFYEELQKRRSFFKVELDFLDFKCDHLLIVDRSSEEVVGCYRLLSSHFFKKFYSESEFELTALLQEPGVKLELGRACILPQYRTGTVIQLLWRGITEYMKKTDTRFLMGCSSIHTVKPEEISVLIRKVEEEGLVDDHYQIRPTYKYHPFNHGVTLMEGLIQEMDLENRYEPESLHPSSVHLSAIELPPLILTYLKAGAKLAPLPAIDLDFHCIDFFTLLDRENMNPLFLRRYFGK